MPPYLGDPRSMTQNTLTWDEGGTGPFPIFSISLSASLVLCGIEVRAAAVIDARKGYG